jgi:hypothetical protein
MLLPVAALLLVALQSATALGQGEDAVVVEISYDGSTPIIRVYRSGSLACEPKYSMWAYGTTVESFAFINFGSFKDPSTGRPCIVDIVRDTAWNRGTVVFRLDKQTASKYALALGLGRFAVERNSTTVVVSFENATLPYLHASHGILMWQEPLILYSEDRFTRVSLGSIDVIYDKHLDTEGLEAFMKGLAIADKLREAYGPSPIEPYLAVIVGKDIPDPYGAYGGAHNLGSVVFIHRGDRSLFEAPIIAIHELAHSWLGPPLVDGMDIKLKEGGAEFSALYFGMLYFPDDARQYFSREGYCGLLRYDPNYGHGAVGLFILNLYIQELSRLFGANYTIVDVLRAIFINTTGLPMDLIRELSWQELDEIIFLKYDKLVIDKIPHYMSSWLNISENALRQASQSLNTILLEAIPHIQCTWPFYDDYIKNRVISLINSLVDPSPRIYVHYEVLENNSVKLSIYNFNELQVSARAVIQHSDSYESSDVTLAPMSRSSIVVGPLDKVLAINVLYQRPLEDKYETLAVIRPSLQQTATVTVTNTVTVTATETATKTLLSTTTKTIVEKTTATKTHHISTTLTKTQTITNTMKIVEVRTETTTETREITSTITTTATMTTTEKTTVTEKTVERETQTVTVYSTESSNEKALLLLSTLLALALILVVVRQPRKP